LRRHDGQRDGHVTVMPIECKLSRMTRRIVRHAGRWLPAAAIAAVIAIAAVRAQDRTATTAPVAAAGGLSRAEVNRQVAGLAAIGRQMFSDPALSGSGRLACATCHSPAHAYGPSDARPIQPGGPDLMAGGLRAVPGLTYLQATPHFAEHFHDDEDDGDESVDAGPTGGLTWDGRVDRLRDQALIPLLSPVEMANPDRATLAAVIEARYGTALRAALGASMPAGPESVLAAGLRALEAFQQDHAEFFPYTSKYDAYLAGTATLTPQEVRGLKLFNDEARGNCASCHVSERAGDGTPPQFTDYGLIAVGAPRNPAIAANDDPHFFDLGLCGPLRTDLADRPEYCGLFKTPTLRNVAIRRTFFHNGVFHSLRDVVAFYVERDTRPEKWYPRNADGSVRKFDDLPPQYHGNINTDPPFDRDAGDPPALAPDEIDDVVAFLATLTDGYRASQP
jgi:cytochrome c peroxidase